jgi:hypothetical protein
MEQMKLFFRILAAMTFGFVLVGAIAGPQSRASEKQISLTGMISDSMCGRKHMISGDDAKCVRTCIKGGSPYALVVSDKVYPMQGKAEDLDKLAGQTATVVGSIVDSALQVASVRPAPTALSASGPSSATSDNPTPITMIEGLVRDIACPIQNKEATATKFNLKCAQDCARLGSPLIVLTPDGTVYTPISDAMPDQDQRGRLMPFLGKYVRVKGQVYERAGSHAIAIKQIEEMKDVPLITNAE